MKKAKVTYEPVEDLNERAFVNHIQIMDGSKFQYPNKNVQISKERNSKEKTESVKNSLPKFSFRLD
jgi:hypothetical protein